MYGALARRGITQAARLENSSRREARGRRRALLGSERTYVSVKSQASDDRPRTHLGSQSWASVRTITATERKSANLAWRAKLTAADRRWDADHGHGFTPFGSDPKTPARAPKPQHQVSPTGMPVAGIEAQPPAEVWARDDRRWS